MKKILFVEDEPTLQKTAGEVLHQEGYEVITAGDGVEGLRMAQSHHPDLILLDLILPKKDGFGVLKELKANPETTAIPVIVLTNLEGAEDIERALTLGATTYLIKANYELSEIVEKIKQILAE